VAPTDVVFHDRDSQLGEVLRRLLRDPELDELTIVVAWARSRGLTRLEGELVAFRERGVSRIVVGIDEGGATNPGLMASVELFTHAFVFHERSAGTFHPKMYLACGKSRAALVVGSSNATPGGLFFNHEVSLEVRFSLPEDADHPALVGAKGYVARLIDDAAVCRPLTAELVKKIGANEVFGVAPDEARRSRTKMALPLGADKEDLDLGVVGRDTVGRQSIFGTSKHRPPEIPGLSEAARRKLSEFELSQHVAPRPTRSGASRATPPKGASVVREWVKPDLPKGDAQRLHLARKRSHDHYRLRLVKAKQAIEARTYFREQFFGLEQWDSKKDSRNNDIEVATVTMDVIVAGTPLGLLPFDLEHAPHREGPKGSCWTVLLWGPLLGVLHKTDYSHHAVWLSRFSDGTYRLEIV
jgi:HKD family nuclease